MDLDVRLIYRLIPRTHEFENYIFLASHFSPEWDGQPAFKFNMDLGGRLIYRLIPRTHGLLESYIFLPSHFSPEWDGQPAFKLYMDLDVLLIYRLIPRAHGLLGYTATFATTPISRFFGAFFLLSRMHTT
jgi:hypothetical protein